MEQSYSACYVRRASSEFFLKIAMYLKSRGNERMNVPQVSSLHRTRNLSLASNRGILVNVGNCIGQQIIYPQTVNQTKARPPPPHTHFTLKEFLQTSHIPLTRPTSTTHLKTSCSKRQVADILIHLRLPNGFMRKHRFL
jgi:hypothetical protein